MLAALESAFLGVWTLLFWGALLVCAVAVTVFAVRRHAAADAVAVSAGSDAAASGLTRISRADISPERSDTLFWDLFMGSAVALPALLIPTLMSPWAGVLLTAVGVTAGVAAYRYSPRLMAWQEFRLQRRQERPVYQAAAAQHEALLARWRRYELDPACSIDYPAITDVRMPETSALIRAMREAEQLRAVPQLRSVPHNGYPSAVERLVLALAAAERAAGIPVNGR